MVDWGVLSQPAAVLVLGLAAMFLIGWVITYTIKQREAKAATSEIAELKDLLEKRQQLIDIQMQDLTNQLVSNASLNERAMHAEKEHAELEQKLAAKDQSLEAMRAANTRLEAHVSELQMAMQKDHEAAEEKLKLLEEAKVKLGNEFRLLASQIFEERGKALTEQNRSSIDEVLKPMREQLGEFRKRVDEVHLNDAKDRASLKEHLAQLEKLNRQMSEDALGLTQALKGESKAQGNWGEMILERILESSGLRKDHEFLREDSTDIGGGKRLRPDVIVRMPGDKHIIIDSKVSLTDYERAVSANDNDERSRAIKAHVGSMKAHIKGLADKHYAHLPGVNSPDYVLMFMPIEGAYMMAIEADQSIFESAFERGVAVVTPSTLYATLKLIEQLWRHERQSENVVRLIERASRLHDKVVSFVESFEEIGTRLDQAQKAYDTSMGRIKTGPGNVIRQIDELGKLAGKTQKELPKHLLAGDRMSDQDDDQ